MSREKKEKTLMERIIAKEKVDLTRFTIKEIEEVIYELAQYKIDAIRREEIEKLNGVVLKAAGKIAELVKKNKK